MTSKACWYEPLAEALMQWMLVRRIVRVRELPLQENASRCDKKLPALVLGIQGFFAEVDFHFGSEGGRLSALPGEMD